MFTCFARNRLHCGILVTFFLLGLSTLNLRSGQIWSNLHGAYLPLALAMAPTVYRAWPPPITAGSILFSDHALDAAQHSPLPSYDGASSDHHSPHISSDGVSSEHHHFESLRGPPATSGWIGVADNRMRIEPTCWDGLWQHDTGGLLSRDRIVSWNWRWCTTSCWYGWYFSCGYDNYRLTSFGSSYFISLFSFSFQFLLYFVYGLASFSLLIFLLQFIGLGIYDALILVESMYWLICSCIMSILSFTIGDSLTPFVVILTDFVQHYGGFYFLSHYYQEPLCADMITHHSSQSTHYFTAAHLLSDYHFYEGLFCHLLKVIVTSPLEYGCESTGLSTTTLFGYIHFIGIIPIHYEWRRSLHGMCFLIGDAVVVASGGLFLPSQFYHICLLSFLFAASATFLVFGYLPKELWFCFVFFHRVDFHTLSSLMESSWKLIFLLY